MAKPTISAFFPCFNDEKTIGEIVLKVNKILRRISLSYEIIVINDGSTDGSLEKLRTLQKKVNHLKIVDHKKNRGYGGALRSGFRAASKDLVFYTDGDGQYDVGELPLLLAVLKNDIDVVNGIKIGRQDTTTRVVVGHAYKSLVRNLFDLPIYDPDCDYRLIRRRFLRGINLEANSGAICVELVKKLQTKGARFREISVHHYPRRYGQSQFFKPLPLLQTARDLVSLWLRPSKT